MQVLLEKEDFFIDLPIHCNYRGNEVIADILHQYLFVDGIDEGQLETEDFKNKEYAEYSGNLELDRYLQELSGKRIACGLAGCIVMNCNPFTLGHRYLIETAARETDVLYIFVVEEDQSYFSFQDRLKLVREGVQDLDNVVVMASGRFVLSADTFSEYFHKEDAAAGKADVSKDLFLFGQYIAPCLNIRKRFAGEEPFDRVTRQYNEGMKEILPQFGVELVEIPRKQAGGEVISASKVRKYLREGDYQKIKDMVPECTYRFLTEHEFRGGGREKD